MPTRQIVTGFGIPEYSIERQAIIDGNFQIAQVGAGAAVTNPTINTYPVFDLWKTAMSADSGTFPTIIHSQRALTAGELDKSFYCYKINVNGAGTGLGTGSYYQVLQHIEHGTRNLCGTNKKVTLSFWARSTISGKKIGACLTQHYGSGGSPSSRETINGTNWTLTSTWTKYTYTFTTNTLTGKTFGTANNDYMLLQFFPVWGSYYANIFGATTAETFVGSGDIEIAQVQLCAGDVALPFEPRSFADELRACMRYCEKSYNYETAVGTGSDIGSEGNLWSTCTDGGSGTYISENTRYKVPKRTVPTNTIYDLAGNAGKTSVHYQSGAQGDNKAISNIIVGQSGFHLYAMGLLCSGLQYHYFADARF